MPSPSSSLSALLPTKSPSVSRVSLASDGKASALLPTPSPSESADSLASSGNASSRSETPSPSESTSPPIMIIIADSSVGERGSLALALSEDRTMTSPAVRTNDISTVCFSPNNRDIKQPLRILIKIVMCGGGRVPTSGVTGNRNKVNGLCSSPKDHFFQPAHHYFSTR